MQKTKLYFFLFFLILILIINSISGMSLRTDFITNTKFGTYQIKNCDGFYKGLECNLGFDVIIPTTIAEYTLTDYNCSIINCYATGTASLNSDNVLFSGIEFKDIKQQVKSLSNVKFYILIKEDYTEPGYDYETQCSQIEVPDNKTGIGTVKVQDCKQVIIKNYTVKKSKSYYKPYNFETLPKGNYEWKLEAKRLPNDKIDFVLIEGISGTKLDNWAWWSGSWQKRIEVNITGGQELLTNFTVLVNVSYDSDMNNDFSDIRFVNGTCSGTQTNELYYEKDSAVNGSSALFWVNIPDFAVGTNTICMYYKNPTATDSSNVNAWDINYMAVYHLENITGTMFRDSSIYQNNATIGGGSPLRAGCKIGACINFTGKEELNISDSASMSLNNNNITFEAWIYGNVFTVERTIIGRSVTNSYWWEVRTGTNLLALNKVGVGTVQAGGLTPGYWFNVVSRQTNGVVYNYVNKTYQGNGALASFVDVAGNINIGNDGTNAGYFNGSIDELRISNVTRSSAWLNRSYDNINMSLVVFGTEETGGDLVPPNITYNSSTPVSGFYNIKQFVINVSVTDFASIWFTINNINSSVYSNDSFNNTWKYINATLDQNNTFYACANDTAGNINCTKERGYYLLGNGTVDVNITSLKSTIPIATFFDFNFSITCLTHNCRDVNYTISETPAGCSLSTGTESNKSLNNLTLGDQYNYSNTYSCITATNYNFTINVTSKYSSDQQVGSITATSSSGGAYACDIRSSAVRRDANKVIVTVAVLGSDGTPEDHELTSECYSADPDGGGLSSLDFSQIDTGKYYAEYSNTGSGYCFIQDLDGTCGYNKVEWNNGYIDNSTIPTSSSTTISICKERPGFGYNNLQRRIVLKCS